MNGPCSRFVCLKIYFLPGMLLKVSSEPTQSKILALRFSCWRKPLYQNGPAGPFRILLQWLTDVICPLAQDCVKDP